MSNDPLSASQDTSSICHHPYQTRNSKNKSTTSSSSSLPTTPSKKIRLLQKDLNSARDRLLIIAGKEECTEAQSKEIILADNVSLEDYIRYRKSERKLPVRLCLDNDKIMAIEVPNTPRGVVSGRIMIMMGAWNDQDFIYSTDTFIPVNPNSVYEPDIWVLPIALPPPGGGGMDADGNPFPTMIVEIGYAQSLLAMHGKVANYFSPHTTIRIVLAIKIFNIRLDNTIALVAALYLRSSSNPLIPVQVISFGTAGLHLTSIAYFQTTMGVPPNVITGVGRIDANGNPYPPCNMAGLPQYQMNIPAADLFNGVPNGIPAAAAGGFNLDLWKVQNILRVTHHII